MKSPFVVVLGFLIFTGSNTLCAQHPNPGEKGLQDRVAIFYGYLKDHRKTEAERYVTKDTLDDFRLMPVGDFLAAQIDGMKISPDGKTAEVGIVLTISQANLPAPFAMPRKTNWRLDSDGWKIVIPKQGMTSSTEMMFRSNTKSKPDLVFVKPVQDLSPIKQGEKKIARFAFSNSSDHPVRVLAMLSDCDCLSLKSPKKTYAPGESGEIEVEFDSSNFKYAYAQTVVVVTDPGEQKVNLLVNAMVDPRE
jgi:hypothetical protein